jgi:formylglycine-generating enzyme required for sulfatase activity
VVAAVVNSIGMRLALIPPGRFRMGSPKGEKERGGDETPHEVELTRPFYLGAFPVTQGQYQRVMGENPAAFSPGGYQSEWVEGLDNFLLPVESVSWHQAVRFCKKLTALRQEKVAGRVYRLPTEAEWEYACRAGTSTAFCHGASLSSTQANFNGEYPYGDAEEGPYLYRTSTMGSFRPNAFGLYDRQGNTWEWCQDWFDSNYYATSPRANPPGPESGRERVKRGGCWWLYGFLCRSANRAWSPPGDASSVVGFRVALSLSAE